MNADLKRVRDSVVDDAGPGRSKKRALSSASPAPAESEDSGMEEWMKVVEVRRKEAIYRQMLEYRRFYEEQTRKVAALEAQKRAHEAAVQAVELCWSQVVSTVLSLTGGSDLPAEEVESLEPILDASLADPALNAALSKRGATARHLVKRLTDAAHPPAGSSELQRKYIQLTVEADALKAGRHSLETQLSEVRESRDQYKIELDRTRKALDRQRMEHDKAELEWRQNSSREQGTPGPKPNGLGHATPNGKIEEDVKPSVGTGGPQVGASTADNSDAEALAASRLQELEKLRQEQVVLAQEVDRLRHLANHPSEIALRESPFFQAYLHQMSHLQATATTYQQRFEAAEEKLDQLRNGNLEFRDAITAEARAEIDALRGQVAKQNSDLARLRGQRDEINDELTESKARDQQKITWAQEMENLANSRKERLVFLESEVRRLKGKLGAESGSERYLDFLRSDGGLDGDYVRDLENRLADAEAAVKGTAGNDEAIRIEFERLHRLVSQYERVLGSDPVAAEDVVQLGAKLQVSDKEIASLRLQLSEAESATNALYTEVEGISKLWEGLDRTLSTKVFELKDGEQRMVRLSTEKAKADNKYFQAMRAKDAIDAECKTAQRSVEKQLKLIEKAREVERALSVQLSNQEKGMTQLKNEALGLQNAVVALEAEKTQLDLRLRQAVAALNDVTATSKQRIADAAADRADKVKAQEELEAMEKMAKKLKERREVLGSSSSSGGAGGDSQMKEERDKLLKILRCSCCDTNFKQQVIVKCMHTFCKQCIDDRVNTRQRKCPACGLAFAKEDVQTLYWQ